MAGESLFFPLLHTEWWVGVFRRVSIRAVLYRVSITVTEVGHCRSVGFTWWPCHCPRPGTHLDTRSRTRRSPIGGIFQRAAKKREGKTKNSKKRSRNPKPHNHTPRPCFFLDFFSWPVPLINIGVSVDLVVRRLRFGLPAGR